MSRIPGSEHGKAALVTTTILALASAAAFLLLFNIGKWNREAEMTVNGRVDAIYRSASEEEKKTEGHRVRTVQRAAAVREAVRNEVAELDADGLAEFARNEIDVYRGGYK
jgi:hypothetical protein